MAPAKKLCRSASIRARSRAFCTRRLGYNTIFDLALDGGERTKAMIVDWQYEPIKGALLHIDLKRIAMDKTLTVNVPDRAEGRSRRRETAGRHS